MFGIDMQEVLIIWGDHDQLFPLEMAKELKEWVFLFLFLFLFFIFLLKYWWASVINVWCRILGEKTRLEVMKETSHVPQIEAPAEFNRVVKSFLCGLWFNYFPFPYFWWFCFFFFLKFLISYNLILLLISKINN